MKPPLNTHTQHRLLGSELLVIHATERRLLALEKLLDPARKSSVLLALVYMDGLLTTQLSAGLDLKLLIPTTADALWVENNVELLLNNRTAP